MTNDIIPEYETVTINLARGIKLGEEIIKTATIRDLTVGDLLEAESFDSEQIKIFKIISRRLVALGDITQPGEQIIKMLNPVDFELITQAAEQMDNETIGGKKEEVKKP